MLQLSRGARLSSVVPELHGFSPAPTFKFAVTTSTMSACRGFDSPSNETIRVRISRTAPHKIKAQLATQNLKTGIMESNMSPCVWMTSSTLQQLKLVGPSVRSLSISSAQQKSAASTRHVEEIEMPELGSSAEKPELPIRVPLTPDNKFACYHRHEMVPKVTPPHISSAATVLPDASNVIEVAGTLSDMLESISVEAKKPKTQSQYNKEDCKPKIPAKVVIQGVDSGMRGMIPREDSILHMVVNFPIDLVKDMIADVFQGEEEFVKVKQPKKENAERAEARELTQKERQDLKYD